VLSVFDLQKELTTVKKTTAPWLYEVSCDAPLQAIWDLGDAFRNFFANRSRYPRFKSRKRDRKAFRLHGGIKVMESAIKLPKLGILRLKERAYLPADAHVLNATLSERAGRWYVSACVEEEKLVPANNGPLAGVDLGLSTLATVSDGMTIANPRALARYERKLNRQQREISRKNKDSKNRMKAVKRMRRTYARIVDLRNDAIHKATRMLTRTKSVIVVENLDVKGLMQNKRLAKAIGDAGMREFIRQLQYKAGWYGCEILVAPRFFPSSKTCSRCGYVKAELSVSERKFVCENCGFEIDRDLNAAVNLEIVAPSLRETLNACQRREVADRPRRASQCPPMKQETFQSAS